MHFSFVASGITKSDKRRRLERERAYGAMLAMLLVGVFMAPFYYGSMARSVPEYLKLRFDEKTRTYSAVSFAVMTVFSSEISMHALGLLLELALGWSFTVAGIDPRHHVAPAARLDEPQDEDEQLSTLPGASC